MKDHNKLPFYWGMIHGCNDFASGFMLTFIMTYHTSNAILYVLLYSIVAFGGQLPIGMWVDKTHQLKDLSYFSLGLLLLSIIIFYIHPYSGVVLIGIASAGIHVAGGSVCLLLFNNKTGPLGLFTSPGVLGLTLGILLGSFSQLILLIPLVIGLFFSIKILKNKFTLHIKNEVKNHSTLEHHDYIMISILLFMTFRSFIFDIINYLSQTSENGIILIGIAAFIGKIAGGYAADKVGWKTWIYITLPLSFFLFQFGKENIYMIAFGIACLQSSVPITILLMSKSIPSMPSSATALSLGTSILIAGVPLYIMKSDSILTNAFNNQTFLTILSIFSILICVIISILFYRKVKTKKFHL